MVTRRRGGVQDPPLSVGDVVDAALRVTARAGLDALTVRGVAEELAVTPPAVHYHLRGKDDLLDRVCEAVSASIDLSVDPGAGWEDQYVQLVLSMDRTFEGYPGVAVRALSATGPSAAARRIADAGTAILRTAGMGSDDAVQAFAASQFLFTGWLVLRDMSSRGQVHPALLAAGMDGPVGDGTEQLEVALRRLLAGWYDHSMIAKMGP